jgi:hypothetical protein
VQPAQWCRCVVSKLGSLADLNETRSICVEMSILLSHRGTDWVTGFLELTHKRHNAPG